MYRTDPADSEIVFSAMTEVYNQKQLYIISSSNILFLSCNI